MTLRSPFQGRACPSLKSSAAANTLHRDSWPKSNADTTAAIWTELHTASLEYPQAWASPEEGAMLLGEEVDELWDEVRHNRIAAAQAEAVQVAAMALRFIIDLTPSSPMSSWVNSWMNSWPHHDHVGPNRPLSNAHEAFGFLKREYDTLWANVAAGTDAAAAAARVAMMAARFITEITGPTLPTSQKAPQ